MRCALVCFLALVETPAACAAVSQTEKEGKLVLENDHVRAVVEPAVGAALVSFTTKPDGKERLAGPCFADSSILPARRLQELGGLTLEVSDGKGGAGENEAVWELAARLPKEMEINFWAQMVGRADDAIAYNPAAVLEWPRPYENLKLVKRYRLTDDSSALAVEYEVTNAGDEEVELCLGTTHAFAGSTLCIPTRDGAAAFRMPVQSPREIPCLEYGLAPWLYDVPAAWIAMLADDGAGLVGWSDPRHVSFLHPDLSTGKVTLGRTRVRIGPGATFRTRSWLMPVTGLSRVDGAGGEICASFQVAPQKADGAPQLVRREFSQELQVKLEKVDISLEKDKGKKDFSPEDEDEGEDNGLLGESEMTEDDMDAEFEGEAAHRRVKTEYKGKPIRLRLQLASARDRDATVSFRTRLNPRGEWQELATPRVRLAAGKNCPVDLAFKPKLMGTHVVEATIRAGETEIARFEHPVIAGHASGFYLPAPPPREGELNREFCYWHIGRRPACPYTVGWQPSREVETPHFDLADPLSGGAVKALFIVPIVRCREVVELAQRMEIDYDVVVTGVRGYGAPTGRGRKRAATDAIDMCKTALSKPHEVIVLPVFYGQWLPVDIVEEIARQVREEGVGLVFSLAEGLMGPFAEFSERAKREADCPKRYRRCQTGRGRVVFVDGQCKELMTNWLGGSDLMYDDYVSDFAKQFLWAARGDPPVSVALSGPTRKNKVIDWSKLGKAPYQFDLENLSKTPFKGRLRAVLRQNVEKDYAFYPRAEMLRFHRVCAFWEERGRAEREIEIGAEGEETCPLLLPAVPAGTYSLDMYVLDEQGGTVTWERLPFRSRSEADISSITLIRGVREPREIDPDQPGSYGKGLLFTAKPHATLELSCRLTKAEQIERVRLFAADPWGRVITHQEKRVQPGDDKEATVGFSFPLKACLHRVLVVNLRAFDAVGCVRERRLCGFIHPRPEREPRYEFRAYANASEVDRRLTDYDARFGASPFYRAQLHAWCNLSIQAWIGGPPTVLKVTVPGEVVEELPELPVVGAFGGEFGRGGSTEGAAGAVLEEETEEGELEELELVIDEKKPIDPRDGWIRVPCMNHPKVRDTYIKSLGKMYHTQSFFGPFKGGAGDEWYVTKQGALYDKHNPWRRSFVPGKDTNSCRCEHCLRLFKAYAKDLFAGDLAALNREWRTTFKNWEEVDRPIVSKTVTDYAAPPESRWPYVIGHRRFDDDRVAELLREMRDVIKAVDTENRFGWGAVFKTSLWSGLDMYLMSRYCDNNQLGGDRIKWASFGSPTNAGWVGYQKKYSFIRENYTAWATMFAGFTAAIYYGKGAYPMHRADFSFMEAPKEMFRSMREIRELGFDRLLVGHRQVDPVAIHYDPVSVYIAHLEDWEEDPKRFAARMVCGGRSYMEFCYQAEATYTKRLATRGLLHFATAYAQLEKGHFGKYGTPKLLFLPYTQCISDKQAATLDKFVKEGGLLVGDVSTGLRNGHGTRRESGCLDHVFGLKRRRCERRARVRADKDGNPIPVHFGKDFGEPFLLAFGAVGPGDVVASSAKPLSHYVLDGERQPAFLVNEYGKGKAIYLNFVPGSPRVVLDKEEGKNSATDARKLKFRAEQALSRVFDKIMGYTDVRCPVEAKGPALYRFGEGPITYICLDRNYEGDPQRWQIPYEVRLRKKHHVYDSRRRQYVGFTDQFEARFSIKDKLFALVYAALPYKVERIEIKPEQKTVERGETFLFEARLQPPEAQKQRHVFSLRVRNPKGEDIYWYGTVLEGKDGVARGRIDLALNDTKGTWQLQLTDSATGVREEQQFTVE